MYFLKGVLFSEIAVYERTYLNQELVNNNIR